MPDELVKRYLGLIFVIVSLVTVVILVALPGCNPALANTVVGVLLTCVVTIITYYFGTSEGSRRKSELIQDIVRKEDCK
jgi:uncharacterized RDD family membrane protein YckC